MIVYHPCVKHTCIHAFFGLINWPDKRDKGRITYPSQARFTTKSQFAVNQGRLKKNFTNKPCYNILSQHVCIVLL